MRHEIKNGIVTRRGFLARSAAAALSLALGSKLAFAQGKAKWNAATELAVSFTTTPDGSGFGRVQRPYVAVWIEDAGGTPVRTLGLWMLSPPRGNRYLNELRRWYAAASSEPAFAPTSTSPTPNPGSYSVVWDGKNDKGAPVEVGDYYVCVESAREHGPYSLVREKVSVGSTPFKQKLGANSEIKDVSVEFRKHA
ncbi:DUF2271 domain-containing protein [Deinococcus sp.]|uniref:DUF2271 domain-containing protein n=1 Tax=Deinococcus sp. TaxID=47478 RepID=UPI003CC59E87